MQIQWSGSWGAGSLLAASVLMRAASAGMPDSIAVPGETVVATMHAEGAQVYRVQG